LKIVLDNPLKTMYNFSMKIRNLTAKYNSHKGGSHTSAKDYNRQQLKQETNDMANESTEPNFSKGDKWKELFEWEKKYGITITGYLDPEEILDHLEGYEEWQYRDIRAIKEAIEFAYNKSDSDWGYQDYIDAIERHLADYTDHSGYGC